MKNSLVLFIFVAFLIICQDNKENASGGGVVTGGGGGAFLMNPYQTGMSNSQQYKTIHPDFGRVHAPFTYQSPSEWQPNTSSPQQQASMLNVPGRDHTSGIPTVPSGAPPLVNELQSFNLMK